MALERRLRNIEQQDASLNPRLEKIEHRQETMLWSGLGTVVLALLVTLVRFVWDRTGIAKVK
jgi:hypothetical protein